MLASFSATFFSVVVLFYELITLMNLPPLGLLQQICAWKGTFLSSSSLISMNLRSSSFLTQYSNEILVLTVAFAKSLVRVALLSLRSFQSSFLNIIALWSMILASTFSPTTSSLRMLAKSSASFSGLTTLMLPLVSSTSLPMMSSLEASPLMVMMLTVTFLDLAQAANYSQNCFLPSSITSKEPMPMLAIPSVQRNTEDPGLPLAATSIAEMMAGPKAVCPLASVLFRLLRRLSQDCPIGSLSLKLLRESMMVFLLLSLSPRIFMVSTFSSPRTITSLLNSTNPIFLWGSAFLISCSWFSIALRMHCFLEMKVLSLLWFPGRKLNWASSPGSMNCLSISISSLDNPNLRFIFPFTSLVVFMLPETSMQNTKVASFSVSIFSWALSIMQTTSYFEGISSFSIIRMLGYPQNSHFQTDQLSFISALLYKFYLTTSSQDLRDENLLRIALHFLQLQGSPPYRFFYDSFMPSKVTTKTLRSSSGWGGCIPKRLFRGLGDCPC